MDLALFFLIVLAAAHSAAAGHWASKDNRALTSDDNDDSNDSNDSNDLDNNIRSTNHHRLDSLAAKLIASMGIDLIPDYKNVSVRTFARHAPF
jgi:hypothetical protein